MESQLEVEETPNDNVEEVTPEENAAEEIAVPNPSEDGEMELDNIVAAADTFEEKAAPMSNLGQAENLPDANNDFEIPEDLLPYYDEVAARQVTEEEQRRDELIENEIINELDDPEAYLDVNLQRENSIIEEFMQLIAVSRENQ